MMNFNYHYCNDTQIFDNPMVIKCAVYRLDNHFGNISAILSVIFIGEDSINLALFWQYTYTYNIALELWNSYTNFHPLNDK